jgi:hypothetical protein
MHAYACVMCHADDVAVLYKRFLLVLQLHWWVPACRVRHLNQNC